jgi:hypothetical protein
MRETIFSGGKKDRARKAPARPAEDLPPHPDPARRIPETSDYKNGHAPTPTLQ